MISVRWSGRDSKEASKTCFIKMDVRNMMSCCLRTFIGFATLDSVFLNRKVQNNSLQPKNNEILMSRWYMKGLRSLIRPCFFEISQFAFTIPERLQKKIPDLVRNLLNHTAFDDVPYSHQIQDPRGRCFGLIELSGAMPLKIWSVSSLSEAFDRPMRCLPVFILPKSHCSV